MLLLAVPPEKARNLPENQHLTQDYFTDSLLLWYLARFTPKDALLVRSPWHSREGSDSSITIFGCLKLIPLERAVTAVAPVRRRERTVFG